MKNRVTSQGGGCSGPKKGCAQSQDSSSFTASVWERLTWRDEVQCGDWVALSVLTGCFNDTDHDINGQGQKEVFNLPLRAQSKRYHKESKNQLSSLSWSVETAEGLVCEG